MSMSLVLVLEFSVDVVRGKGCWKRILGGFLDENILLSDFKTRVVRSSVLSSSGWLVKCDGGSVTESGIWLLKAALKSVKRRGWCEEKLALFWTSSSWWRADSCPKLLPHPCQQSGERALRSRGRGSMQSPRLRDLLAPWRHPAVTTTRHQASELPYWPPLDPHPEITLSGDVSM